MGLLDGAGDVAGDAWDEGTDVVDDGTDAAASAGSGTVDWLAGGADAAGDAGSGGVSWLGDVTGAEEIAESDAGQRLQEQASKGPLSAFDASVRAGTDFVLDNPNASIQDTVRGGLRGIGSTIVGENVSDEEFGESVARGFDRAGDAVDDSIEGTALDNPVTDGVVYGADIFVGDPSRAVARGLTGVDTGSGSTEGTVGAIDVFDVGVTVGTAGLGGAATSGLARGGDEGATFASRFLSGGDEAAASADDAAGGVDRGRGILPDGGEDVFNPSAGDDLPVLADDAASASDDAAGASDDAVSEAVPGADESGSVFDDIGLSSSDDAASASDDAAGGLDDVGEASDDAVESAVSGADDVGFWGAGGFTGAVARGGDELGSALDNLFSASDEAAGAADDAAGGADDVFGASDDVTQASDESVETALRTADETTQAGDEIADEGPGVLRRALGTTTGKVAAGTGGLLAAGALMETLGTFDRLEATDPQTGEDFSMVREKDYQPTETHSQGGSLWEVRTGQPRTADGYTVIVGASGRNIYILDENGERTRAQVSPETLQEAVQRSRNGTEGGDA